jgi:hypothetical protein
VRLKLTKFEGDQSAAQKFGIYINESKKFTNFTKVDELIIYFHDKYHFKIVMINLLPRRINLGIKRFIE